MAITSRGSTIKPSPSFLDQSKAGPPKPRLALLQHHHGRIRALTN